MASDRNGDSRRVKVILDANALMMPVQFGIDIIEEIRNLVGSFEPIILEDVLNELGRIARGRGKNAAAARVGISLCDRCTIIYDLPKEIPVDEKIMKYAVQSGSVVVTNDRILRDDLHARGIDVIYLRKKQKLELMKG